MSLAGSRKSWYKHEAPVHTTRVNLLNYELVRPTRGGIILYTVYNDMLYFGLALDSRTHDLTDAGGTINYNVDRNVIRGSIREFEEETLNIFEPLTEHHLQYCPVVYDDKNLIIFVYVTVDPNMVSYKLNENYKAFMTKLSEESKLRRKLPDPPEVCGITWLTKTSFQYGLNQPGIIYSRVRKFLSRTTDFYHLL